MVNARYINRVVIGIVMFIPYYLFARPFFNYMDWLFEDNVKDYVVPTTDIAYRELFDREK